ncbi:MAG: S-layer homology domain-containing protein [Firmicutes bacterium]|nr:S-layer homology domain-containing protein [Bacillota bacterium]
MKKIVRITAVLLSFLMLASFTDVASDHWSYPYVSNAEKVGLMIGDGDGNFRPKDLTTKEEVATIIYRILNYGTANMVPKEREYTDEEKALLERCQISDWAWPYLLDGFASGFWTEADFSKRTDTVTAGKQPLDREKLAQWLVNAEGIKTSPLIVLEYADVNSADPALMTYIDACRRSGLMIGDDVNAFNPKNGVNRAEVAVILTRALKYTEDGSAASAKVVLYGTVGEAGSGNTSFYMTVSGAKKPVFIDPSAGIIIDGAVKTLADLLKLKGKTVNVSAVIGGNVVVVQTKPVAVSGEVTGVKDCGTYKLVSIKTGDITAEYIYDQNTHCTVDLQKGISIKFISDGTDLLEIN